jgi:hypothetical protein
MKPIYLLLAAVTIAVAACSSPTAPARPQHSGATVRWDSSTYHLTDAHPVSVAAITVLNAAGSMLLYDDLSNIQGQILVPSDSFVVAVTLDGRGAAFRAYCPCEDEQLLNATAGAVHGYSALDVAMSSGHPTVE